MRSFFTLMVTILIYSLSFAQNNNDCNIIPNKSEFSDFIKFDENKNVKSLNSFIEMKKKEKDELESFKSAINNSSEFNENDYYAKKNGESEYNQFKRLKFHLNKINQSTNKVEVEYYQHESIQTILEILNNNIDFFNIIEQNENPSLKNRNDELKKAMEDLKYREKKDSAQALYNPYNSWIYENDKGQLTNFIKILYSVNSADFNKCDQIIKDNLNNVYKDIENAENYLSDLTSRELTEFSFKKHIMVIVGALIAIILVCFFTGVLYKATDAVKQKLIGETGLQFITIFVIIIAVILFGVMNILKGSELAAILSAIAGYILGKTAPPKSDKTLEIELEILRLKSQEAERLKQEEADKKVAEAAEAIKKQEEENKRLGSEEVQDDIKPDITTNSITEEIYQENEDSVNIEEDPAENTDQSNEDIDNDENINK